MIDNNDIKIAIGKLEPGKFQNMCNKILYSKGYENINQLGSQNESDRTTAGTPDTFILHEGKFILVEYTVQKQQLFDKIDEDIDKCLKKIKQCDIKNGKIIYFHTSSNLQLEQFKALIEKCEKEGVNLEIYNIDMIANLLRYKYPLIAKEYLGIEPDTLQLLSIGDFLQEYNSAPSSVKINKNLLYREVEQEKIINTVNNNQITLISGKSGVGKTHIILDLLNKNTFEEYEVFCIKNRSQEIFSDMKKYLLEGKKYIIFVDDINNINGIEQLLYFLEPINKFTLKIIATVRDYAKDNVLNKILEYEDKTKKDFQIGLITIPMLNNEQLIEIIKSEVGIKNDIIIRNILKISNGNTRLMMMASKVLLKEESGTDLKVKDIYQKYFNDIINLITKDNETIMKTLAVISIVNAIDINNNEHIKLMGLYNIDRDIFIKDMNQLHNCEVIDMIDEDLAKISEQCLSNYSLYFSLFVNRDISLEKLIVHMMLINKSRLTDILNMIISVFQDETIMELIKDEVLKVWDNIDEYSINKLEFLQSFGGILELETINYAMDYIDAIDDQFFEFKYIDINNDKNKDYPRNDIINLLGLLKYSNRIEIVIDVLIKYIKKDSSVLPEIYKLFVHSWQFEEEIYYNDFHIHELIVDKLYTNIVKAEDKNIIYLFLNIVKDYLKVSGDFTKNNSKSGITIYQYSLCECEQLRRFRNNMFDSLIKIADNQEYREYLIDVLDHLYSSGYGKQDNLSAIIESDKEKIYELIEKLKPFDFKLAVIIDDLYQKFKSLGIKCKKFKIEDNTYKIYKMLKNNSDIRVRKSPKIQKIVDSLDNEETKLYIREIGLMEHCDFLTSSYRLEQSISYFVTKLFEKKELNKEKLLTACINNKVFKSFCIEPNLYACINDIGYQKTKDILLKLYFEKQFDYLIACYSLIPERDVNEEELSDLLIFITKNKDISNGYYVDLSFLDKYMGIDKNIYPNIAKTICLVHKENKIGFDRYMSLLFNKFSNNTPSKLKEVFQNDYEVLFDSYLIFLNNKNELDYDGSYFKLFIDIDYKKYINKYLSFITSVNDFKIDHNYYDRLQYVFQCYEEIIEYTLNEILKVEKNKRKYLMEGLFKNKKELYEKEEKVLLNLIKKYCNNTELIFVLFDIISERSKECRLNCILEFIKNNKDITIFKRIRKESYHWSWSGSEVVVVNGRIEFYNDLKEEIEKLGVSYIKHAIYIDSIVSELNSNKKSIIRREFLSEWY